MTGPSAVRVVIVDVGAGLPLIALAEDLARRVLAGAATKALVDLHRHASDLDVGGVVDLELAGDRYSVTADLLRGRPLFKVLRREDVSAQVFELVDVADLSAPLPEGVR